MTPAVDIDQIAFEAYQASKRRYWTRPDRTSADELHNRSKDITAARRVMFDLASTPEDRVAAASYPLLSFN